MITFLRSCVFGIFLVLSTILFGLAGIVLLVIPFSWRWRIIVLWPKSIIWVAKYITGIHYEIKGAEHISPTAAIYLGKHQSSWETLFLPTLFTPTSTYIHKKELNYIPFFGWGLASVKQIPINRSKRRDAMRQVIELGSQRLAEGRNVILFPEGSRMPVGTQGTYKLGGSRLAVHTGMPVIPFAHNAGHCWAKNAFLKKPGKITLSFGPPIPSKGLTPEAHSALVEAWIETEMRKIDPDAYDGPYIPPTTPSTPV